MPGGRIVKDRIDALVDWPATPDARFFVLAGKAGGQTGYGDTAANGDLILHGTSHATKTTSYILLQPSGGRVGVGTSAPLAPLHVGGGASNNSVDSQVLISRAVDSAIAGNGHAFSDSSDVNRPGTIGYNSYDSRVTYSGSENYDHYVAFQTIPSYGSSGTMARFYGLYDGLTLIAGTITDRYGVYLGSPSVIGGAITNQYALYIQDQIAATNDFAIVTNAGNIIFNEGGDANTDFRVEGDTEPNLFFVDASADKVGIGTATPLSNLQIKSAANKEIQLGATPSIWNNSTFFTDLVTLTNSVNFSRSSDGIFTESIFNYYDGTFSNLGIVARGAIKFVCGSTADRGMIIKETGNVGIGTVLPGEKLEVNGNIKFGGILKPTADSTTAVRVQNAAGSASQIVVDTTNNRVGINRTPGAYALDVAGNFRFTSVNECYIEPNYAGFGDVPAGVAMFANNNFSYLLSDGSPGKKIATTYFDGTTERSAWEIANVASGFGNLLLMKGGGRVSIGNSSANNELDVTGTVQCDGLRVDVTPTAEVVVATHTAVMNFNGTSYKVLCLAA